MPGLEIMFSLYSTVCITGAHSVWKIIILTNNIGNCLTRITDLPIANLMFLDVFSLLPSLGFVL
jgi:hypothetical protein